MRRLPKIRLLIVASTSLVLAACGESPYAPPKMSAEAVARALPAISDARLRLVDGIETPTVRERVRSDLGQIELALIRHDAQAAGFRLRLLRYVVDEYAARPGGDHADDADLVAIGLALVELAFALDLPLDLTLVQ